MPHLQQVRCRKVSRHRRLGHEPRITHQQRREAAVRYLQHQRIFIEVVALASPALRRVQHPEPDAIDAPLGAHARGMPARLSHGERREQGAVGAVIERLAWVDHRPHPDPIDQRPRTTDVIAMCVRQHEGLDPPHPLPREQWQQDASPGIASAEVDRPGINREPVSSGGPDQRGVPLANIDEK